MLKDLILLTFILLCLWNELLADPIYVSTQGSCMGTCDGSVSTPYDNLLQALQQASSSSSAATIILLYDASSSSYVLEDNSGTMSLGFTDLTIKALLQNDPLVSSVPALADRYIQASEKLTVSIKTTGFSLLISGSFSFQNIIFDADEDIKKWSTVSPGSNNYTTYYNGLGAPISDSLFVFSNSDGVIKTLDFIDADFINFQSPHLQSLINLDSSYCQLKLTRTKMGSVYFDSGTIVVSAISAGSTISIVDSSFENYNAWDMFCSNSMRSEGYLLNSKTAFSGTFELSNSNFINSISSLRNSCWFQTKAFYNSPMNNFLTSDPRSRSDLWGLYNSEIGSTDLKSSLIYFKSFEGTLEISESNFKNIIGTSGSVLRIDETEGASFLIDGSTFENNFAYDRFANIMIAKSSNPSFSALLDCPRFEMKDSNFLSAAGCPGSYGNIFYLCPWDATPPKSALSSYSFGSNSDAITSALSTVSATDAYVKVESCVFENNLLAVSNSIAIVGAYAIAFEGNTFKNNGGTTAELAKQSLSSQGSYFEERYPEDPIAFNSSAWIHFGQSTAVFVDHFILFSSNDDTFQGNWGPWEGSLSLASSLTLQNWIKLSSQYLKLSGDSFNDHQGVPVDLKSFLKDESLANGVYMEPIISISVDITGSNRFSSLSSTINNGNPVTIGLEKVDFLNNIASYDYSSYTYNIDELGTLIHGVLPQSMQYQTGLLKVIWVSQAIDDVSRGFQADSGDRTNVIYSKGEINNNELLSMGCLFSFVSMVENVKMSENKIFMGGEEFPEPVDFTAAFEGNIYAQNQGLFCMATVDFTTLSAGTKLTATHLMVDNNRGILFNVFSPSHSRLYLSDSVFVNNTCLALSMLTIREFGEVETINNIFINNTNSVGIFMIFFEIQMSNLFNVYLRNRGLFAALYFIESIFTYFNSEGMAKVYWNTVYGDYPLFNSGMISRYALVSVSFSTFMMFGWDIKENYSYGGLILNVHASALIYNSSITDHKVVGASVIGTMLSVSSLSLENVVMRNNTLIKDPSAPNLQAGLMIFFTSRFTAKNLTITGGSVENGAFLIFGNLAIGSVTDAVISDFYNEETNGAPLMHCTFSTLTFENWDIANTTGLFSLSGSKITMTNIDVQNLRAINENHFLMSMYSTTLKVNDFKYEGNGELGSLLVLIGGDSNSIWLNKLHFIDAIADQNAIFQLTSSAVLYVTDSIFEYSWDIGNSTLFDLDKAKNIVIQNNVFKATGSILKASNVDNGLYFLHNSILTSSNLENIVLGNVQVAYILGNIFSSLGGGGEKIFEETSPSSQVRVTDALTESFISNNLFFGLYGTDGIVQINAETSPYLVNFEDNIFVSNSASRGGALFLSAADSEDQAVSKITIQNCLFSGNIVSGTGKGGAIYQTTADEVKQDLTIKNSVFLKNEAKVYGGAIYFDYSLPDIDELSKFRENYADGRLNHIGSYPVMLDLVVESEAARMLEHTTTAVYNPEDGEFPLINQQTQVFKASDITSGMMTSQKYHFQLIDVLNQVVYSDNTSILEIYPKDFSDSNRHLFSSILSMEAERGVYTLENFTFNYIAGKKLSVTMRSTAIPKFENMPTTGMSVNPSIIMEANFRMCGIGEFQSVKNNLITCKECPISYWQVDEMTTATSCSLCELSSTLCRGGSNVGPKNGYWRFNETSTIVVECQRKESCIGNNETYQGTLEPLGTCAEHYQGNACANCEKGWASNSSNECIECQTNTMAYVLFFVMTLLQSLWIAYGIKQTLQESHNLEKDVGMINDAALLRIFTNFTQIFVLIMGIPISWPNLVGNSLSTGSKVTSFDSAVLSTDCFFLLLAESMGVRPVFMKTLIVPLVPVVYIMGGFLFWIVRFLLKKKSLIKDGEFSQNVITTIVIICYNIQPDVIQTCFALFQCQNLYRDDSPLLFLVEDYDVQCWEGEHMKWILVFAVPCLVLWTLVMPGIVLWQLWKNKHDLKAPTVWKKYCFIYNGYRDQRYYWEMILMMAKVILISVIVFSAFSSVNLQIYAALTLILLLFYAHSINNPYENEKLNHIENGSLMSLGALSLLGIYFQIFEGNRVVNILAIIFGVASFLYFFVYFLAFYFSLQAEKLKKNEKVMKVLRYLDTKVFCCFKHIREYGSKAKGSNKKIPAAKKLITQEFKALKNIELTSPAKLENNEKDLTIGSPIANRGEPGEDVHFQNISADLFSQPDALDIPDVSDDSIGSEAEASPVKRQVGTADGFGDHLAIVSSQRASILFAKSSQRK